ncbi:MAG: amidohydrolase [Oscillospiraceae bacterium]|nr:amidohydrolase [Oscillospiraceae bacterium]
MLIDFHTHCFPDAIAGKAIPKLSHAAGGLIPGTDGTADGLRESMKRNGVDISVIMNIATNAHQQKSVNDFAAKLNNRQDLFAFGSVFPFAEDALSELERICELGLSGVKLHPDYQGFSVDDPRVFPIYRKISELGLITLFHAGVDYGFKPPYGATPEKMAIALREFSSPVIAAHWGGVDSGESVIANLCGKDIYFDISFGYGTMPKYIAETIIEKHGADKLLFGSDTPWHTPAMELRLLESLGLDEVELEKIKSGNAKKLLGI